MKGVSGDNRNLNTIAMGDFTDEGFHTADDFAVFTLRKRVIVLGILHFTDGADAVGTVDNQVYLYGWAAFTATPRIILMGNGVEVKPTDNLADMPQTDTFEGKPVPCVLLRSAKVVAPEMLIGDSFDKEVMMKQGEEVYQLIDASILLSPIVVAPQEITLLQVIEHVAECSIVCHTQFTGYFYARVAITIGTQQTENLHIALRISEERQEESAVLALQFSLLRKEERVNVVGKILSGVEQTKIVGDATENHVCLKNSDTRPTELTADEIFFGLSKGERTEVERMGGSFVQLKY